MSEYERETPNRENQSTSQSSDRSQSTSRSQSGSHSGSSHSHSGSHSSSVHSHSSGHSHSGSHHHKHHRHRKHRRNKKRTLLIVLACVVLAVAVVVVVLFSTKKDDQSKTSGPEAYTKKVYYTNTFALFGVHTNDTKEEDSDRSDSIMLVSINEDLNRVRLISILRDSKVPIRGYEPQKINAAYKYGGPYLALDTINDAFDLNIKNYVSLDFEKMENLVNLVGGVDVDLTQEEVDFLNETHPEFEPVYVGVNTLDGAKALAYSRIRYIDSDQARSARQQNVLEALLHKLRVIGKQATQDNLETIMESMETSYFYDQFYRIFDGLDFDTMTLERYTVPDRAYETVYLEGIDETGSWVWDYDLEAAGERINRLITE